MLTHRIMAPRSASPSPATKAPPAPGAKMASKEREMVLGFRAWATLCFSLPATLLNSAVPIFAIYRGDVVLPNVMLSDIMASHPLYSAFYTWGFTLTMAGCCYIFQESGAFWRREMPEARSAVDRFTMIMHTLCAPCLFGLVAFQYKEDIDYSKFNSIKELLMNFDFWLWFAHVAFTGVFFLVCCWLCFIYVSELKPALDKHQLTRSGDRFWRLSATVTAMLMLPGGVVVRFSHLLIGGNLCGVLLVIIEMAMIQCFVVAAFAGSFQCMKELDAESPMCWQSSPSSGKRAHSD